MNRIVAVTMLVALGCLRVWAQPILQLKARLPEQGSVTRELTAVRRHRVIQFAESPSAELVAVLAGRGATVLQYVPDNGLLVSAEPDINLEGLGQVLFADALTAGQKWSPDLDLTPEELLKDGSEPVRRFMVEFYPDVAIADSRALALQVGLLIREHADMLPHHLLLEGTRERAWRLAGSDLVAYVFPPSPELERGEPIHNCVGAATQFGMVGQYVARIGQGWDGPGKGAARLSFLIENAAARLPPGDVHAEIQRALREWARYVQVDFAEGGRATDRSHIDIRFARGAHGDPYPFDGAGRVLAHTFYPAPPNPEPIAGDLHLDDDESWKIGNDVDLYSVVLHELGHALGLGHSDRPGAVMYAYYRKVDSLTAEDIAAVQELYAARGSMPPAQPPVVPAEPQPPQPPAPNPPAPAPPTPASDRTPPALKITSPATTSLATSSPTVMVRGVASDNVGVSKVTWNSNVAGSGTAQGTTDWNAEISLAKGTNNLTIRAWDAAGNTSWRSVMVTRR